MPSNERALRPADPWPPTRAERRTRRASPRDRQASRPLRMPTSRRRATTISTKRRSNFSPPICTNTYGRPASISTATHAARPARAVCRRCRGWRFPVWPIRSWPSRVLAPRSAAAARASSVDHARVVHVVRVSAGWRRARPGISERQTGRSARRGASRRDLRLQLDSSVRTIRKSGAPSSTRRRVTRIPRRGGRQSARAGRRHCPMRRRRRSPAPHRAVRAWPARRVSRASATLSPVAHRPPGAPARRDPPEAFGARQFTRAPLERACASATAPRAWRDRRRLRRAAARAGRATGPPSRDRRRTAASATEYRPVGRRGDDGLAARHRFNGRGHTNRCANVALAT